MKYKHALIIKDAIEKWIRENADVRFSKIKTIVCAATWFNWEVFMAAKVEGDTLRFMARELYPYLTSYQITDALQKITSIDGTGIKGSGVSRD